MTGDSRRMTVIDVGTNSVRSFSAEIGGDEIRVLDEFGEVTRLGAGLARTGSIAEADASRTLRTLRTCLDRSEKASVVELDIVGTEVFRAASNGADTAASFSRALGHMVRILSPDEEAEASYLGVVGWEEEHDPGAALIMDVGGGSTELVLGEGVALQIARSVPQGALRITEACLNQDRPQAADMAAARAAIDGGFEPLSVFNERIPRDVRAIGVGGTACAIGAWAHGIVPYDPDRVHGCAVSREELSRVIGDWAALPRAEIMDQGGMSEGRAAVVLGGALIFERLLERFNLGSFRISVRGLRHGLILRRFLLA